MLRSRERRKHMTLAWVFFFLSASVDCGMAFPNTSATIMSGGSGTPAITASVETRKVRMSSHVREGILHSIAPSSRNLEATPKIAMVELGETSTTVSSALSAIAPTTDSKISNGGPSIASDRLDDNKLNGAAARTVTQVKDAVAKFQTIVDNLNKTWLFLFLISSASILMSIPAFFRLNSIVWCIVVSMSLFIAVASAHMIGIHNTAKVAIVWLSNIYFDTDDVLLRRITAFERRSGLTMADISSEVKLTHNALVHHSMHSHRVTDFGREGVVPSEPHQDNYQSRGYAGQPDDADDLARATRLPGSDDTWSPESGRLTNSDMGMDAGIKGKLGERGKGLGVEALSRLATSMIATLGGTSARSSGRSSGSFGGLSPTGIGGGLNSVTSEGAWEGRLVEDNICASAWTSKTSTLDTSRQLHYHSSPHAGLDGTNDEHLSARSTFDTSTEEGAGSSQAWSPVAKWNLRRRANQKRIPNPSNCSIGSDGYVSKESCPGYYLYVEGGEDLCDCVEALVQLGYDMEVSALMGCFSTRRDRLVRILEDLLGGTEPGNPSAVGVQSLVDSSAKASRRSSGNSETRGNGIDSQSTALSPLPMGAGSPKGGVVDVLRQGTNENDYAMCIGTFDASVATLRSAAVAESYHDGGFNDAFAWDEGFARLTGQGSASFLLRGCQASEMTFEARYSAAGPVGLEVTIDSIRLPLADGGSVLHRTHYPSQHETFARGNAVFQHRLSPGTHLVRIRRTRAHDPPLFLHRLLLCTDGTTQGCPESASAEVYCYVEVVRQRFTEPLESNGDAASTEFDNLQAAVDICSARMDCKGVNIKTSVGEHVTFQAAGGELLSLPSEEGPHRHSFSAFRRQYGPAGSNSMCIT